MRKVRKIADLMRDHFSLVYGHDYPTKDIDPSEISDIGLLGADENGSPTLSPREGEPICRLFAIVGKSQAVELLGEGSDPYELITRSFTELPEGSQALALWAQATMRAIPNDLKEDFDNGATPNQPRIWHEIKERGRVLDTDQIVVIGVDGFVTDCYLPEGRIRMETNDAGDLAGRMPISLASLFVMLGHTNTIYARVRKELAEPIADQFAEVDEALRRLSLLVDDAPETPTDTQETTPTEPPRVVSKHPGQKSSRLTPEKLLAEIRKRTADLDHHDLSHLETLTAKLDDIAEAVRNDLGLTHEDCDTLARAFGIASEEIGLTPTEAVEAIRELGLDD